MPRIHALLPSRASRDVSPPAIWIVVAAVCLQGFAPCSAEERAARRLVEGPLLEYVRKADPTYSWKVKRSGKLLTSQYAEIILTSQTWQGVDWKHQLFIINPASAGKSSRNALLFITGGSWKHELENAVEGGLPREAALFAGLAEQLKSPVAVLLHVPFQPMFDGRKEDAIIALTFKRFMESGDSEWPLLLPMVKSAVRAMDTVQQYAKQNWQQQIDEFTISGASKRGWTTWLTGATDRRATAIAPMVIDMLNMSPQLKHQERVWGKLSYKINDYSELNLPEKMDTPAGQALAKIVDPFQYRTALTQPKLIILGTNDHYWPLDALNLYWEQLQGQKRILYVPNNRHGLRDMARVTGSLMALHHQAQSGRQLPELTWKFEDSESGVKLSLEADQMPKRVHVWLARSESRDFRPSKWESVEVARRDKRYEYVLNSPGQGYAAVFGEAVFDGQSLPFYLSTTIKILAANSAPSSPRPR